MHLIILQKKQYYDLQNYMECVFNSMLHVESTDYPYFASR